MKKMSLNAFAIQNGEVLTRSQLKKVLGGTGSDPCLDECERVGDSCTIAGQTGGVCRSTGIYPADSCPGKTSVLLCFP